MLKAVLFDLDNTLIDFMSFKIETAKAAAKAMVANGLPADERTVYDKIFMVYERKGIEYQKTFYEVVKDYGLEVNLAEKIQQAGITAYLRTKFESLKPYPDVKPTLRKLKEKGLKIGIVTDAPRNKAWQRLVIVGLQDEFDFVITHDDTKEFKPHPLPFKLALEKLKIPAGEVLFVGDHPGKDIKGAGKMGMKTCLAEYGKHIGEYEKTDYSVKSFKQIIEIADGEGG